MIIAIDPGLRHCGVALGEESPMRLLKRAELVLNPEQVERGPRAWVAMCRSVLQWAGPYGTTHQLIIEVPRIYPRSDQRKGDLNDLLELAGVVGAIATQWASVKFYYPAQWKGQVPKKIMTERIRKQLRPVELENIISVGAKDHNTLDAVGIFLHSVGRL